jgi:hypothetical protein
MATEKQPVEALGLKLPSPLVRRLKIEAVRLDTDIRQIVILEKQLPDFGDCRPGQGSALSAY